MKNQLYIFCFFLGLIFMASACQKKYDRVDLAPAVDSTLTTTPINGNLLVKTESKTSGSSEASTSVFGYNANSKLIKLNSVDVDSANKSTATYYFYQRDFAGKVTKIFTNALAVNNPNLGLSDSLGIYVHYASASVYFDYTVYSFDYGGLTYKDSTAYVYNNNVVTDLYFYQGNSGLLSLTQHLQYVYKNNNVVAEKVYDPTVSIITPVLTYTYDYDTKVAAFFAGNDAFLPGLNSSYASKSNSTQITVNDNTTGTALLSYFYTLKYNTNNMPTDATIVAVPGTKSTTVNYTYQ